MDKLINRNEMVDEKVRLAKLALNRYKDMSQEEIDHIVAKTIVAAIDAHGELAKLAVEETGRGVFEDKATKNMFAAEYVGNHMRDLKTVGVIEEDDLNGIVKIAEPVGVIAGLIPVTNPTSTTIFKAMISLKTRNPIIFSFHPHAMKSSIRTAGILSKAAIEAGAPEGCILYLDEASMQNTSDLMNHEGVSTILATGGNAMVKAAYSCGKPALGVGAGNVPSYIEKSANIKQAVNDIALSKSFDNGMICASEQSVIVDEDIYDEVKERFEKYGVVFLSQEDIDKLEKYMFDDKGNLNSRVVGKPANEILDEAGIENDKEVSIIACERDYGHLIKEKLSPVLTFIKVKDSQEGLIKSKEIVENGGLGHSAAIHTMDYDLSVEFGKTVPAIRIIWNAPSTFGGIGNVYNEFIPSLTLGCGSYGNNSVGDNVSAIHLLNIKKVGIRNNNMQWFKVPEKIYFERGSVKYLSTMKDVERVFIVADETMEELGFIEIVKNQLKGKTIHVFTDVEPDPSIQTVRKGVEEMNRFKPDTIIALGGGSPMDAAKGMWIFYEDPKTNFDDLKQKFIDIRKRAIKYPELGRKAKMVCIPTTSGTGSEVTPFAVISDPALDKKYPLADYSMVPDVAIVDSQFVENLPKVVTADTGMDVLTHAVEAYVSNFASDYTDGLALQTIKLVFKYLERSVKNGNKDLEAKEKMHNASTMAGMAFGNAFLGINHSLAHKIGGRFKVPHGRINAIIMPYVIRYNGTFPNKPALWPKYNYYKADERYAELARILGLKADTVEEGVESFATTCHELAKNIGIDMSFEGQGIDKDKYFSSLEDIAYEAYEDQCSPANPKTPMVKDMIDILKKSY